MSQLVTLSTSTETENVCTTCKHFTEQENGEFFCRYYDAFLSPQTFNIPCEFQEKIESPTVIHQNTEPLVQLDQKTV